MPRHKDIEQQLKRPAQVVASALECRGASMERLSCQLVRRSPSRGAGMRFSGDLSKTEKREIVQSAKKGERQDKTHKWAKRTDMVPYGGERVYVCV